MFPKHQSTLTLLISLLLLFFSSTTSAMYFVSREEWGARPPDEAYTTMTNAKGVKIHYLGSVFSGREHSECDDFMRSVQDEHMDDSPEDYFDIAYNLAVCQHGYVYDGRGRGHRSGANGDQTLNAEHYAVLAFVAQHGVTTPSSSQITGLQDAIAYLRRAGAGDEIKGHRDGFATACPGEELYSLLNDGTLDPGKLWDGGNHTVQAGETLGDLSYKYNVPKQYIIDVNGLESPYTLVVGDVLEIPARGVPLGETLGENGGGGGGDGDDDDDDSDEELTPFPGEDWFKSAPNSPIVTAMGERLVEEGCGKYSVGPGSQWSDVDRESYKCWQEKLGYTGSAADGWPGQRSWDQLKVPLTEDDIDSGSSESDSNDGKLTPFPGVEWFKTEPDSPIITAMGESLVAVGCDRYSSGPGSQWSDADKDSYQCWQEKLGYTGANADGWPGETSWDQLKVPWTGEFPSPDPILYEPFPGAAYFTSEPSSWIVNEMSLRLVEVGCDRFATGPGPEWTDDTKSSYACWQEKLGYTGSNADGWPGEASWDALKVPRVTGLPVEPFPGTDWFKSAPNSAVVTEMGKRLVTQGCNEYSSGPGPQWSDADRNSYRCWQQLCGYTGSDLDGWPDENTWEKLVVPRVDG